MHTASPTKGEPTMSELTDLVTTRFVNAMLPQTKDSVEAQVAKLIKAQVASMPDVFVVHYEKCATCSSSTSNDKLCNLGDYLMNKALREEAREDRATQGMFGMHQLKF